MPDIDPIGLIVAIAGLITAVFGPAALVLVALINRGKKDEPKPLEQGQPAVDPATASERERRRKAERELKAFQQALRRANDQLAAHGLPLVHPDN